jgi:hypothetical protein
MLDGSPAMCQVIVLQYAEVFDAATVERLAGPYVYARGVAYWRDRRVERAEAREGRLEATVRGTMPYSVELWADRGRPRWSCTCPAAEDGSFCKHCTAVALSLGPGDEPPPAPARGDSGSVPDADDELIGFVKGLAPDRLAEIVLETAASDWRLHERLRAEARAARGAGPDLAAWRRRIDAAFTDRDFLTRGFVAYRDAPGWAAGIDDVIDALADLCDAGHHDAAARLAEHAHRRADGATGYVDDSDGWLTDFSTRMSELHLRACEAGSPDPEELAIRLVEMELGSDLDGFRRCAATHAEVLGEPGLAAFREHLEPYRERAGRKVGTDEWSSEVYAVRQAMVGWALGTGDPDALIEAHSQGRTSPGDVLEIALALDGAGRADESLRWARRGIADWGDRPWQVGELRDFLARKLRDRGQDRAAVELFWKAFVSAPSLTAYRRLLDEGAGEDWLRRCRDELRRVLAEASRTGAGERRPGIGEQEQPVDKVAAAFSPFPPVVHEAAAALVEILLYEGLVDGAWSVAWEHGCRAQLWLALARAREDIHPLDAVGVYESAALAIIERKNAKQYGSAVDLMVRIRRLADSSGEPARFVSMLERVRTEHKAKRKLRSLLDAQGW